MSVSKPPQFTFTFSPLSHLYRQRKTSEHKLSGRSAMTPIVRVHNLFCLLPALPRCEDGKPRRRQLSGCGCGCVDWCCWAIGCVFTAWWLLMLVYSSLPSASLRSDQSPGAKLGKEGLQAFHPVVFVPGMFAGELELWEGKPCAADLFRRPLWGGRFGDIFKRPGCWTEHMKLDSETGLDPPGVRVRTVPGLAGARYFTGLIENLGRIGYEGKNMYMATYDWRLSFQNTEVRDQSLSRLKSRMELMVRISRGRKVVVVPYSMGALYFLHFIKWVEAPSPMGGGGGSGWCSQHIKAIMNIGPAFLGIPNAMSRIFSDDAKEFAFLIRAMSHGVLDPNIFGFQTLQRIMHVSRTWDSIYFILPKGGDAVWGGINLSIQGDFDCELRNKRTVASLLPERSSPSNVNDAKFGFLAGVVAHFARIMFSIKINTWSSLDVPFSDSKKLVVDSTFLQTKSSEEVVKAVTDEIDNGRTTANNSSEEVVKAVDDEIDDGWTTANNYISKTVHDLLCFAAPKLVQRACTHFSHTIADDLDDPKYSHYKYWSNPLEMKLPDAPDIEIYCLYGVDMPADKLNDEKFHADGGGSVPLLSAGFMCAKGWRGRTRFNPSGMRAYVREYTHRDLADHVSKNTAHADIVGNSALIEDIMRVTTGAWIGGDQIHSNILAASDHVKLHVG